MVVVLSMPLLPSSSSSFLIGMMSRTSVSHSSVVQFQPAAPGTCPWSYAAVSTSTSATRTFASFECSAIQSVVTSTSATAYPLRFVKAQHDIWTRLAAHTFRKRVVRARRAFLPPADVRGRNRLEILELNRAREHRAKLRQHVAHALPHKQKLAVAFEEQILMEHAARQKRRHHLPVRRQHAVRGVRLAAWRAHGVEFLEALHLEVRRKPATRFAHARLAPHFVEAQNQIHVLIRGFGGIRCHCRLQWSVRI